MASSKLEAGAAGHGAEPRGKRTEDGQATYLIAIAEALWEEMERDERVFMLGEDIGVYGGAFKVTEGFLDRFGPTRVVDTPIAQETIVGASLLGSRHVRIDVRWIGKLGSFSLMAAVTWIAWGNLGLPLAEAALVAGWMTFVVGIIESYVAAAAYLGDARRALATA